jgi:hypothetical protein
MRNVSGAHGAGTADLKFAMLAVDPSSASTGPMPFARSASGNAPPATRPPSVALTKPAIVILLQDPNTIDMVLDT